MIKTKRVLSEKEYLVLKLAVRGISVIGLHAALHDHEINMLMNTVHRLVKKLEDEGMLNGWIERVEIADRKRPRLHVRTREHGLLCVSHTERTFSPRRLR